MVGPRATQERDFAGKSLPRQGRIQLHAHAVAIRAVAKPEWNEIISKC